MSLNTQISYKQEEQCEDQQTKEQAVEENVIGQRRFRALTWVLCFRLIRIFIGWSMEFYDPLGSVIHLLLHIIIILARFFKIQQQVDDLINVPKYSKRLNFSVFPEKPLFFLAGNRTVCLVRLKTTISKDLPVPWGVELELYVQVLKPSSRSYYSYT